MRTLRVEPDEILHQDDVELLRLEQLIRMVIHEFLLNGSVKSLTVGIHLRSPWVGVVVRKVEFRESLREMFLEFRTVVREYELESDGEDHAAESEEFLGGL